MLTEVVIHFKDCLRPSAFLADVERTDVEGPFYRVHYESSCCMFPLADIAHIHEVTEESEEVEE